MKRQITFFIFLLFTLQILAQEDVADYKQFEDLAKKINDIQRTADGKTVKSNETPVLLTIPETNFIFNYHNQSATTISKVDKDALLVHENIDLADVNHLGIHDESFGSCGIITISTNKKQNFTTIVAGDVQNHKTESIGFYFSFSEKAKGNEMFNALSELIYLVKVKKGILTAQQAKQQQQKWKQVEKTNTTTAYYKYWQNEPDNIFTDFAYYRLTNLDKSFRISEINLEGFKLGMKRNEFEKVFFKKFNNFKSNDKLTQEVLRKFKMQYYSFSDGLTYHAGIDFRKQNTGISSRKLYKNNEIQKIRNQILYVSGKGLMVNLDDCKLKLEYLIFGNSSNELETIKIQMPLNMDKYSKENILSNFIKAFDKPNYIDTEKVYYVFSGYSDFEVILYFAMSSNECLIEIKKKSLK